MIKIKYIFSSLTLLVILTFSVHSQTEYPYSCLQYRDTQCIRCPLSTHVYQNQCFNETIGCLEYQNGDQCRRCNTSISYLSNKKCILNTSDPNIRSTTLLYIYPVMENYGELYFNLISLADAQKDKYFLICDNFMKRGQYNHFISKSGQAVISVHTFDLNKLRKFKILYYGSGGGIFMCLIQINMNTNQIQLKSFVVIGVNQIVQNCIDYTINSECYRCRYFYHLQSKVCYQNIPKCIRYYKNICLECRGSSVLIQNRCISDCKNLLDTRSIRYYHNEITQVSLPNILRNYYTSM